MVEVEDWGGKFGCGGSSAYQTVGRKFDSFTTGVLFWCLGAHGLLAARDTGNFQKVITLEQVLEGMQLESVED